MILLYLNLQLFSSRWFYQYTFLLSYFSQYAQEYFHFLDNMRTKVGKLKSTVESHYESWKAKQPKDPEIPTVGDRRMSSLSNRLAIERDEILTDAFSNPSRDDTQNMESIIHQQPDDEIYLDDDDQNIQHDDGQLYDQEDIQPMRYTTPGAGGPGGPGDSDDDHGSNRSHPHDRPPRRPGGGSGGPGQS